MAEQGIFGPTPEQLEELRRQQLAERSALAARVSPSYSAGFGVGNLLTGVVSKLFNLQDPAIERATKIQSILKEVNSSLTDEERANPAIQYIKAAERFAAEDGFQNESMAAQAKAQDTALSYALTQSQIAKNLREKDPKFGAWQTLAGKATPASVKASIEAGYDFNLLEIPKENNTSAGEAYVSAINILVDPKASPEAKSKAFSQYQMLFPAVTSGAFGQYVPQFGPNGIQFGPAPGSPEAQKVTETAEKKVKQLSSAYNKSDVITSNITEALKFVNDKTTGSIGQATRALPFSGSSDAARLAGYVDTIKANIGFDQLQKMRTESPTGGALGQVAVKELDYLQAALGNLNPDLPADMLKEQLSKVQTHYNNFMEELEKEMQAAKGKIPQSSQTKPPPQASPAARRAGKTVTIGDVEYEQVGPGKWRKVVR